MHNFTLAGVENGCKYHKTPPGSWHEWKHGDSEGHRLGCLKGPHSSPILPTSLSASIKFGQWVKGWEGERANVPTLRGLVVAVVLLFKLYFPYGGRESGVKCTKWFSLKSTRPLLYITHVPLM